jgi:hypothetical protein
MDTFIKVYVSHTHTFYKKVMHMTTGSHQYKFTTDEFLKKDYLQQLFTNIFKSIIID